jgi:hypothetical protein
LIIDFIRLISIGILDWYPAIAELDSATRTVLKQSAQVFASEMHKHGCQAP